MELQTELPDTHARGRGAAALGVSIWSLLTTRASRRLARLGLALASVSLLALALAGLLVAAGLDPPGACGGG